MHRSLKLVCAVVLLAGIGAAPATAQRPGTVELMGFGQATLFDDDSGLTDLPAFGFGGGIGLFLLPNLALEGAASHTSTELASGPESDVTWVPLRARLAYHIPASATVYPILGVGYAWNDYSDVIDASDDGVTGLLGLKTYVSERVAFRLDAQVDFIAAPFNEALGVDDHTHLTFGLGLSMDLGAGRSRDSDGDGVRDRIDACPGTPAAATVDARGCRMDDDGDGVYNGDDRCPGTPAEAEVDAEGCPVDGDGDGVADYQDQCADTPSGVSVDASGCPVDADGDGVPDYEDACGDTPAGASVDARGCRLDTDGDGVYDDEDRCAGTSAGTEVDARGCPVLFEEEATALVLKGVTFETNSAQLTASAQAVLDRVAESLNGNPDVRVRVVGHTDNTGNRAYNVELSRRRAESVVTYLVAQGVAEDRLEADGVGPDQPVASNETAAGRQQNRRVELVRIDG